jgi:Reverse transcriptase (RNA-dependent DNA polymerase)
VKHALRFFNFGDRLISWILTVCADRSASIIFNDGKLGPPINLERGNAQGDVISPFIFNICYQVLLLKLECDLQIKSIDLPEADIQDPDQFRNTLSGATLSVSYRAKKIFAFADDCNILCLLDKISIEKICTILRDFEIISGLSCNVQKSNILLIGHVPEDPASVNEISVLGFNIVDEITVLGFKLNNSERVFANNYDIILNRLKNQHRIWNRFNLSLPGRLSIAKTMFYSQILYLGCVIPLTGVQYNEMDDIIHKFASGNLRISKSRTFLPVELGGLGLFGVENFITAQKSSWVRRCKVLDQDWKITLIKSGHNNLTYISGKYISPDEYPILNNIGSCYEKFREKFTGTDNNYLSAHLINNGALTIGIRSKECLKLSEAYEHAAPGLDPDPQRHAIANILKNLKIRDLMDGDNFITKINFQQRIGAQIEPELWERLDRIRRTAKTRYGKDPYLKSVSIDYFFNTWKRGSRRVRRILERGTVPYIPHNMIKFADNTETIINYELSKNLNKMWSNSYLSTDIRTFTFKMHNNSLPYNTILSHFVRGIERNCTFCDLTNNALEEDENILHLFYNCTTSENLREMFFKWLTDDNTFTVTRREFFGEFRKNSRHLNEILSLSGLLFKKFLWDCKVRKCLPNFLHLQQYYINEMELMSRISKKISNSKNNCGINFPVLGQQLGVHF